MTLVDCLLVDPGFFPSLPFNSGRFGRILVVLPYFENSSFPLSCPLVIFTFFFFHSRTLHRLFPSPGRAGPFFFFRSRGVVSSCCFFILLPILPSLSVPRRFVFFFFSLIFLVFQNLSSPTSQFLGGTSGHAPFFFCDSLRGILASLGFFGPLSPFA